MRAIAILLALLVPSSAAAFSDRELFDAPVLEGGGGSRYFSGSRNDGYACSVCHGTVVDGGFAIEGLPRTVVPGQHYQITVRWTQPELPHGVHVEISNPDGSHALVTTTPAAMLGAESRCGNLMTGEPALYVLDRGVRRIVGAEPCGAVAISLGFTAGSGPVELAVAGVQGNRDDVATGDKIFEERIVIGATVEVSSGCATGGTLGWGMLVVALAVISRRRAAR
jgi:hypothetical protein